MAIGTLLGLAHALAGMTYVAGTLMQSLPVPKREWKAWGPVMMWDATIAELGIATVSIMQLIVDIISNLIRAELAGPFSSPSVSFLAITSQLVSFDAAIFILISIVNSTIVLAPVAELLVKILGLPVQIVTTAIIIWSIIHIIIGLFPNLWLVLWETGLVFFAIPFRIGRKFASYLMASAIVLAIALPIMPSIALWLEGHLSYELLFGRFQDIVNQVQSNPLALLQLIPLLATSVADLLGAMVIALVIFPFVYLFILSMIIRSLANAFGGSASGPIFSEFVVTQSRESVKTLEESR
ncbi:MAG: hypothetical protein H3Z53_11295 [archaeon]|nr:hypothetical protein [archaeon]MCP8314937.1 hypothetical protein [archaeon]